MCADKLDEGGFELVGKVDDKAILVAADIEDGSVVSEKVHVVSKSSLQVRGSTPIALGNDLIPGAERYLGLRVSLSKDLKGLSCYYSMFPPRDQQKFPPRELFRRTSTATLAASGVIHSNSGS
jgi:hypothetical protein